jgi:hypothetical protein
MELIMTESIFRMSVLAAVAKKVIRLYFNKELLNHSGNFFESLEYSKSIKKKSF